MKNLNKTVFNAIQASKINIDSIQGIRKVIEELKKGQNTEKSKQLAHDGSGMELSFDANEISEWKILIDNKLVELRNELENTSDNIMDKMFEKDDDTLGFIDVGIKVISKEESDNKNTKGLTEKKSFKDKRPEKIITEQ